MAQIHIWALSHPRRDAKILQLLTQAGFIANYAGGVGSSGHRVFVVEKSTDIKGVKAALAHYKDNAEMWSKNGFDASFSIIGKCSTDALFAGFSDQELKVIKSIRDGEEALYEHDHIYQRLYEHYMDEMPYGTAKARTGDPDQWITERLSTEESLEEVLAERKIN